MPDEIRPLAHTERRCERFYSQLESNQMERITLENAEFDFDGQKMYIRNQGEEEKLFTFDTDQCETLFRWLSTLKKRGCRERQNFRIGLGNPPEISVRIKSELGIQDFFPIDLSLTGIGVLRKAKTEPQLAMDAPVVVEITFEETAVSLASQVVRRTHEELGLLFMDCVSGESTSAPKALVEMVMELQRRQVKRKKQAERQFSDEPSLP